jgi:hypothetical protein
VSEITGGLSEAWLEHPTLTGRGGSDLFEIMRKENIESVPFGIHKDSSEIPVWYRSNCVIIRDQGIRTGLRVSYLSQDKISDPAMPRSA